MTVTLSPSQQKACTAFRAFLRHPTKKEFLLAGYAGTGKSFLVKYLLELAWDEYKLARLIAPKILPPNFIYSATTNKAVSVLKDMLGVSKGSTIHRTLGLAVRNNFSEGTTSLWEKNDPEDLRDSLLIIDEGSMINQELHGFIKKLTNSVKTCKVLYVGDSYQLPPVNENMCAIFNSIEDRYFLTDIQRQAADSPIITFSHKFREVLDDPSVDWPLFPSNGSSIIHHTSPITWHAALKNAYLKRHKPNDCKIIAWSNERVRNYNKWIRKQLGYTEPFEVDEILLCNDTLTDASGQIRAVTDSLYKVLSSEPDTQKGIEGHQLVLTRGRDYLSIFQPTNWGQANRLMRNLAKEAKAATEGKGDIWKSFWEIKNEWGDFRPLHAQTVHKSQGSTYNEVFVDIDDIGSNPTWYEIARLLYTAITRASTKVHLYGNIRTVVPALVQAQQRSR
jgi:hypothetical protein